jgi:hypothetical protein
VLCVAACSRSTPEWAQRNQRVIDEFKITGRTRELPPVNVPSVLVPGQPVETATLPAATLAPGVVAKLAWGRGAMLPFAPPAAASRMAFRLPPRSYTVAHLGLS